MEDSTRTVVLVGALAGAGFLAYQYWYLPARQAERIREEQMRRALQAEMERRAREGSDPLAALGSAACQAVGMYYKVPPNLSAGICKQVGSAAADTVRMLPGYAKGAYTEVVKPVASEAVSIVKGAGGFVSDLAKSFTSIF